MNQQALHLCIQWAANDPAIKPEQLESLLRRHDGKTVIATMLDLLPMELKVEYAGALHLRVSGEWAIHPSTAFDTINAPVAVMLEVLEKLLLAHPECRPTPPKGLALAPEGTATGSEGAPATSTSPTRTEASEGIP